VALMVLASDGLVFKSPTATETDKFVCSVMVIMLVIGTGAFMFYGFAKRQFGRKIEETLVVDSFSVDSTRTPGMWNICIPEAARNPKVLKSLSLKLVLTKSDLRGTTITGSDHITTNTLASLPVSEVVNPAVSMHSVRPSQVERESRYSEAF
jgi:hypothetical protein